MLAVGHPSSSAIICLPAKKSMALCKIFCGVSVVVNTPSGVDLGVGAVGSQRVEGGLFIVMDQWEKNSILVQCLP